MFKGIKNRIFWKIHHKEIEKEMIDSSQIELGKEFNVVLRGMGPMFFQASKRYKSVFPSETKIETYIPDGKGGGLGSDIMEHLTLPAYLAYDIVIGVVSAYAYDFLRKIKENREFKKETSIFLSESAGEYNGASCVTLDMDKAMEIRVDFIFPASSSKSDMVNGLTGIPDIYKKVSSQKFKKMYSRKFYYSRKYFDWIELEC